MSYLLWLVRKKMTGIVMLEDLIIFAARFYIISAWGLEIGTIAVAPMPLWWRI